MADIIHTFKRKKIKEGILTVLGYMGAGAGSVSSVNTVWFAPVWQVAYCNYDGFQF